MLALYEASTAKALPPKQRMNHLRQIASSYSDSLKSGDKSLSHKLKKAVGFAEAYKVELKWLEEDSKQLIYPKALLSCVLLVVAAALVRIGICRWLLDF